MVEPAHVSLREGFQNVLFVTKVRAIVLTQCLVMRDEHPLHRTVTHWPSGGRSDFGRQNDIPNVSCWKQVECATTTA